MRQTSSVGKLWKDAQAGLDLRFFSMIWGSAYPKLLDVGLFFY